MFQVGRNDGRIVRVKWLSTWWLIPRIVSGLVHPNYKWINPTYPIYNWGYNPLPKWDEPPSNMLEKNEEELTKSAVNEYESSLH